MSDIHILETDLDLKQNLNIYTTCKQLDTLHLKLNIYDDGLQATLTDYNVRLKALKSDKVPLIQETGITINNNVVTITGDEQLTTASGNTLVELQFINKTTGEKKSTFNLVLKVISTILEVDRTISKATYTLLQELENKLDQASDFLENIDEAIESNTNLIATNATANKTKTDLDLSNTNATNTKNALDESKTNADNSKKALDAANTLAATNTTNLDIANIQAVKNYDALNQLGDATNLAKKVQENTTQLYISVKEIENVKTDYAKKTDVNILASNKAENTTVQALEVKVNQLASDTPKGSYDTLALLQSAFPTGSTGKYIVGATTEEKHWYIWNGSSWIDGGVYVPLGIDNNSIDNTKYARESITPSVLKNVKTGKNKFEGYYLNDVGVSGDTTSGFRIATIVGARVAVIKVEANKQYTLSKSESNRCRIFLTDSYPVVGSTQLIMKNTNDSLNVVTFSTSSTTNYVICYVANGGSVPVNLQLEEGAVATTYEDIKYNMPLADKSVAPSMVNGIMKSGMVVGVNPITVDFINNKIITTNEGHQIIVDSAMYTPLEQQNIDMLTTAQGNIIMFNIITLKYELYTPSDSILNTVNRVYIGSIRRDMQSVFINGMYKISRNVNTDTTYQQKFIITKQINSNYENNSQYIEADLQIGDEQLNLLYAEWDKLVDNKYVTKIKLGNDVTGLPIYRYDFKPFSPQDNTQSKKFPKIIYLGGIHGHERLCNTYDLRFFKELVNGWKTSDVLEMLRFNVHFIVVPVQCPWGYSHLSRINANGVNINRNYEIGWVKTDIGADYSSTTFMTEAETTIIDSLLKANTDAIFALDHHNFNKFSADGQLAWFGTNKDALHDLLFSFVNFADGYAKKKHEWLITDNAENSTKNLFSIKNSVGGGLASYMVGKYNINGIILETIPYFGTSTYPEGTTEVCQDLIINLIGNLLLTVVKNADFLTSI